MQACFVEWRSTAAGQSLRYCAFRSQRMLSVQYNKQTSICFSCALGVASLPKIYISEKWGRTIRKEGLEVILAILPFSSLMIFSARVCDKQSFSLLLVFY